MRKILSTGLFLITLSVAAQPTIEWQKSLGGTEYEESNSSQQTSDGGYIVTGFSSSNDGNVSGNHGQRDVWVVKLTSSGSIEWEKSLGGSGDDSGYCIQQTTDGGYILVGTTDSNDGDVSGNHGSSDFWVVKLSSIGAIQWQKSLGGSGYEKANSVQQTSDGGYLVAGFTNSTDGNVSSNHGAIDIWVIKLSSTGVISWEECYGGTGYDYGTWIEQTSDEGFILAGYSNSNDGDVTGNHGGDDFWVVKLTSSGAIYWEKSLGGSNSDVSYMVKQTTEGGYILTGYTSSNDGDVSGNHGNSDYWVVKLTNTGILEWQKALGGSAVDYALAIDETTDGGFLVAGTTESSDGNVTVSYGSYDFWLVQLTSTGTIIWEKTLGGSNYDVLYDAQQTSDGGFILSGWSYSTDIDVTGNHGSGDYWVVKLSSFIGIDQNSEQAKLIIYPNPSLDHINVQTDAGIIGSTYSVCDFTGKIILSGIVKSENTLIELTNLPQGVYILQIHTSDLILTSRFVKQ